MPSWEPRESTLDAIWQLQKLGDSHKKRHGQPLPWAANEAQSGHPEIYSDASAQSLPTPDDDALTQSHTSNANREPEEDLSIYLPIGSLEKNVISEEGCPGPEVAILSKHNWIHTHTLDKSNNIRIYVNPVMTDRRNSQRSITKLRLALKVLMSKIDRSAEAWEDRCSAQRQDIGASNGAEDESLWYIFNTLQNPNPDVEGMKDRWSRRAMEDLLSDDDFTDLGLKTQLYPYQRRSAAAMVQREAQPAQMLDPRLQAFRTPTGVEYYYDREDGCIFRDKIMYSEACGG